MRLRNVAGVVLALVALLLVPQEASAQTNVLVTGFMHTTGTAGFDETLAWECRGMPTCIGTVKVHIRFGGCTNYLDFSSAFNLDLTTVNLAQSGTYSGTVTIAPVGWESTNVNGTCSVTFQHPSAAIPYTVSWNAASGTGSGTFVTEDGPSATFTFKADISAPPPVFPIVVRSQIDANTATASADIQFRPQDVGQSGGVFVFAAAPATRVVGGLEAKAIPVGQGKAGESCVLAQRNSAGQLVAVTAQQMQAFVTGAFAAQGTSVSILNAVATPTVAGVTFYVGYGANAGAMLDGGIFRNAVLVPGNETCPPLPYMTSLWWNPNESGWGLNLNQQGGLMFGTLFTYDAARAPLWLVMPAGALQADGVSFSGDLYRTTGPAFNANPFTPIGPANITRVGTMAVSFTQANAGTLTYTVNGVEVQKYIQRQVYKARAANCLPGTGARTESTQYQDLWWNANESGWGVNVTHQENTLFATLFTYDASGRDLWLVMSDGARQADGSYLGDLFRTAGSPFSAVPFVPLAIADVTQVGTMRLRFNNGNAGTLTYTNNGVTVTKAITRQEFSTPVSVCN